MEPMINSSKQDIYKALKSNLSKAMKAGFYYQAIFIEYAIIEDRCSSALRHAGVKYIEKDGKENKLSQKLNKLYSNSAFSENYIRKRLSFALIDEIRVWKKERDALIHDLANIPFDYQGVKIISDNGKELVRKLENSVRSINAYMDKKKQNKNDIGGSDS